jgi:hypothetical protein
MTVRIDTTNRSGIAKDFRPGLDFYVVWQDGNGVMHSAIHNTATVSVKKMLENQGIKYEDAEIERL